MLRIFYIISFFSIATIASAQLNNAWIDYSKTYYKFKLASNKICRISQSTLANAGLASVNADHFQLWRNGSEVRIFTSVSNAPLGSADFIEFAAQFNDGKVDNELYRNPDFQLADKYSLETDTSTYFLTVNTTTPNLRFQSIVNNAPSTQTPDAFFMRKAEKYYKDDINRGDARSLGELVYSSSYDMGEGWSTGWIESCCSLDKTFPDLHVYNGAPANSMALNVNLAGISANNRSISIKLNGSELTVAPYGTAVNFSNFNYRKLSYSNLPLSILNNNASANVSVKSTSSSSFDKIVVASIVLTYPSEFNFSGDSVFAFQLDASTNGNYLVIDNFTFNGLQPVLYDQTNGFRLLGEISSTPGQVKFILPPSLQSRNMVLLTQQNPLVVNSLITRNFVDYNTSSNQADYIIISNPILYNDGNGNNYVDEYRQYRSSITGGGYNAKLYDIAELTDQFGFGIKNHPGSIRDFIQFASAQFSPSPKFVFIIGRGVNYIDLLQNASNPACDQMNIVPTFGWPASDILLSAPHGTCRPSIPIGRLAAITPEEVKHYLNKIQEYEDAQRIPSPLVSDKAWMKNFIHVVGGKDSSENTAFRNYMRNYENIAEDTMYGAYVETFTKTSASAVQQAFGNRIEQLFNEGLSFIGYFGHSSANTFEFNLSNPELYHNQGKYPFFNVSGCSAGNFYIFDPIRPSGNLTLSEKYVLAQNRGSIGFLADNHFGIPPFLNFYNNALYKNFSFKMYGDCIGNQIKAVATDLGGTNPSIDYYTRIHLEEINLHGDPALRINSFAKPDYVVEESMIKISPNIISVADNNFKVNVEMRNIGKGIRDSIRVSIKQRLPGDSIRVLVDSTIRATMNLDSIVLIVPINPNTDKGQNQIIASLDIDGRVDELFETNNSATKSFVIFEDELRAVAPANYAIVSSQNNSFFASTANPLSGQRDYVMELDTTRLFNSPFKRIYNKTGLGGLVEFKPNGVNYQDSTVYYWRVAMVPSNNNPYIWNTSSFIYLPGSSNGFNLSHYYQQTDASYNNVKLDSNRLFSYTQEPRNLIIRTGLYPYFNYDRINVNLDFTQLELYGCIEFYNPIGYNNLQVYVFDTATLLPWRNRNVSSTNGLYGSAYVCQNSATPNDTTRAFFEFNYALPLQRKSAMEFIDMIPNGMYVAITNLGRMANTYFIDQWKADTLLYGSGQSLYHKLKNIGFTEIDSFYRNLPFLYFYKKGDNQYTPTKVMGPYDSSFIEKTFTLNTRKSNGTITSPVFGPAQQWQSLQWRYNNADADQSFDTTSLQVWGVRSNGNAEFLTTVQPATDTTLNFVDANTYPFIKLAVNQKDEKFLTPVQLRYLRLFAQPQREGVVAPSILYSMKDTVEQGEPIQLAMAFKNISSSAFDSVKIKMIITDQNNRPISIDIPKARPMVSGDTIQLRYLISTRTLTGMNTLYIDFNPDNDQAEQYHFNNIVYKNFYVRPDKYNPLLDVTFDGVHILNRDVVSSKPHVQIRLKDESKYLALNDTSFVRVQLRKPDQSVQNVPFGDVMQFQPAIAGSGNNTAVVDYKPNLQEDGEYELIVSGRDSVGNPAGQSEYRVIFNVINKPMISNLLNYPNPFTTSTAFVFTLTGSQIPQNMRIQILTVTGKVVREITQQELGPIHIGRNITEYKWDGTDSYGQPLGNGVYLYRVLTNLNGQSLDKYRASGDNTDQFFNKGYGKMYLMR